MYVSKERTTTQINTILSTDLACEYNGKRLRFSCAGSVFKHLPSACSLSAVVPTRICRRSGRSLRVRLSVCMRPAFSVKSDRPSTLQSSPDLPNRYQKDESVSTYVSHTPILTHLQWASRNRNTALQFLSLIYCYYRVTVFYETILSSVIDYFFC